MVPLGRFSSDSSASKPDAAPDASSQAEVGAAASFFFFDPFFSGSADSLAVLTIDHDPAEVEDAAGATVCAGVIGFAGVGAGVQTGSLGGLGVGSGAGRKGSTGAAGAGAYGSGVAVVGGKSQPLVAGAGALGVSHGMGDEGAGSGLAGGGAGGAMGGGWYAGAWYVTVGWTLGWSNGDGWSAAGCSAGFATCPCGVRVRCRAARTLCSICDLRAEYIERFSTDLRRNTKKTATMPMIATIGPARR